MRVFTFSTFKPLLGRNVSVTLNWTATYSGKVVEATAHFAVLSVNGKRVPVRYSEISMLVK